MVRVYLRDNISARAAESNTDEHHDKRQKITYDNFPTKPPTPRPIGKERNEASAAGGSKVVPKPASSTGKVIAQEFAPSFGSAEGRLVTIEDSVKAKPSLAITILQGLALPKDMKKVPQELQPSLINAGAHLVQVCPIQASSIFFKEPHCASWPDFALGFEQGRACSY